MCCSDDQPEAGLRAGRARSGRPVLRDHPRLHLPARPTDTMLANIFLFELRQRLRRISTYVYFLVFFALGCLFALMSGGAIRRRQRRLRHRRQGAGQFAVRAELDHHATSASSASSSRRLSPGRRPIRTSTAIPRSSSTRRRSPNSTTSAGRFLAAFALQVPIFMQRRAGAWLGTLLPWLDKTRRRSADGRSLFSAVLHQRSAQPPFPDGNLLRAGGALAQDAAGLCRQRAGADWLFRGQPVLWHALDCERPHRPGRSFGRHCHRPHHPLLDAVPAQHSTHPVARHSVGESRACGWVLARSSWRCHLREIRVRLSGGKEQAPAR